MILFGQIVTWLGVTRGHLVATCLSNLCGKMVEELKDTSSMRHSDIVVIAMSARRWCYMWDALCMVPVVWMNMYGHRVQSSIGRCNIEFTADQALVRYTPNRLLAKTGYFSPKTTVVSLGTKIRYYCVVDLFVVPNIRLHI